MNRRYRKGVEMLTKLEPKNLDTLSMMLTTIRAIEIASDKLARHCPFQPLGIHTTTSVLSIPMARARFFTS